MKKRRSTQPLGNGKERTVAHEGGSRASDSVVTGTLVNEVDLISNNSSNSSKIFGRSSDGENELMPVAGGSAHGDQEGDQSTIGLDNQNINNNKYKHRANNL